MIYFSKCICDCVESSCASSLLKTHFSLAVVTNVHLLGEESSQDPSCYCSTAQKKLMIKSKL